MQRKKMTLEPGKKYRGYGWLNEYGQINFQAEQKGNCPNKMSLIKENGAYSLYESSKFLKIAVKIEKGGSNIDMIKQFMDAFRGACVELRNYNTD